jgi:hypothetical protein
MYRIREHSQSFPWHRLNLCKVGQGYGNTDGRAQTISPGACSTLTAHKLTHNDQWFFHGCPNQEIGWPFLFKGLKKLVTTFLRIPPLKKTDTDIQTHTHIYAYKMTGADSETRTRHLHSGKTAITGVQTTLQRHRLMVHWASGHWYGKNGSVLLWH